jgi:hypothetical protein
MDAVSQEVRSPNFRSTEKKQKIAKDAQLMQIGQEEIAINQEHDLSDEQEIQSDEKASESSLGKGKSKHLSSMDAEDEESED